MELKMESIIDMVGYIASFLVFSTFYVKKILTLRLVAISSNVAFIFYAFGASLYPIFILHTLLLPLNLYRIFELKRAENDYLHLNNGSLEPSRQLLLTHSNVNKP
jgi:hypothetical protein